MPRCIGCDTIDGGGSEGYDMRTRMCAGCQKSYDAEDRRKHAAEQPYCTGTTVENFAMAPPGTYPPKRQAADDDDADAAVRPPKRATIKPTTLVPMTPDSVHEEAKISDADIAAARIGIRAFRWNKPTFTEADALVVFPEMKLPTKVIRDTLTVDLMDAIAHEARDLIRDKYGRAIPPYSVFKSTSNRIAQPYLHRAAK